MIVLFGLWIVYTVCAMPYTITDENQLIARQCHTCHTSEKDQCFYPDCYLIFNVGLLFVFSFPARQWYTSFNSPTPITPCHAQRSRRYLLHKPSYSRFCIKFRCRGNKGWSEANLNDTVELAVPENHTLEPKITTISCIQPKLWQFEEFLNFPHRRHCIFLNLLNK